MRSFKRVILVLAASSCLFAADPDLSAAAGIGCPAATRRSDGGNAKAASYKPLFGIGDPDADQLKGVARYGELTVAPGGTTAMVSYPAEEQMYFVEEGSATLLYGDEKAPDQKNDFMYLPVGVKHGVANSRTRRSR